MVSASPQSNTMLGSFISIILNISFLVPLRLLDATQSFHSRCSTIFQDVLRRKLHYLVTEAFQKYIFMQIRYWDAVLKSKN